MEGDQRKMHGGVEDKLKGKVVKLYHVTRPENLQSILKDGLLRCHGDYKSAFVFLSEDPDSWMDDGLVLLSIDVDGLNVRLTTPLIENTDEICAWGDIPPERIRVVGNENTCGSI